MFNISNYNHEPFSGIPLKDEPNPSHSKIGTPTFFGTVQNTFNRAIDRTLTEGYGMLCNKQIDNAERSIKELEERIKRLEELPDTPSIHEAIVKKHKR